jgi:hypothetical protein
VTEVQLPIRNRHHDLAANDMTLQMSIGVILARPVAAELGSQGMGTQATVV